MPHSCPRWSLTWAGSLEQSDRHGAMTSGPLGVGCGCQQPQAAHFDSQDVGLGVSAGQPRPGGGAVRPSTCRLSGTVHAVWSPSGPQHGQWQVTSSTAMDTRGFWQLVASARSQVSDPADDEAVVARVSPSCRWNSRCADTGVVQPPRMTCGSQVFSHVAAARLIADMQCLPLVRIMSAKRRGEA